MKIFNKNNLLALLIGFIISFSIIVSADVITDANKYKFVFNRISQGDNATLSDTLDYLYGELKCKNSTELLCTSQTYNDFRKSIANGTSLSEAAENAGYEFFVQPTLTSDNTTTSYGVIKTSASSYYNTNTAPYKAFLNSVSSTVDNNYWQLNNTTDQSWLKIEFPFTLYVSSISFNNRPRDNCYGEVTAYTSSDMKTIVGNKINASSCLASYNMSINPQVTNTIYFKINSQNQWFGIQNIKINGVIINK